MDVAERIAALEARVAQLERGPWESLQVKELKLVDSQGEVKGEWRLLAGERESRLALYGDGGKQRVVLSVTHDGDPVIGLVDSQGRSRAALGTRGTEAYLTLRTPDGDRALELLLDLDGKSKVVLS